MLVRSSCGSLLSPLLSGRGGLWLGLSHTGGYGSGRGCNRARATNSIPGSVCRLGLSQKLEG